MDEYFGPNCGATLNNQPGFDPDGGIWTCTSCGKLLMDDDVYEGDTFEGVWMELLKRLGLVMFIALRKIAYSSTM